jgi:hypothetical protein
MKRPQISLPDLAAHHRIFKANFRRLVEPTGGERDTVRSPLTFLATHCSTRISWKWKARCVIQCMRSVNGAPQLQRQPHHHFEIEGISKGIF